MPPRFWVPGKDETHTETAPQRVGRYRLLRKIARGGMAEVYLARSQGVHGFEKTVAIKRILRRFSEDPQFVRMMVDEAKISVLLNHPNIAQIFEFGEEDGQYFLVMEYVPGQSLSALHKRLKADGERIGVLEACFLVVEALQGLHAAHTQTDAWGKPSKIIHRDVSPQNVLLSYDGHVKLIDFGIARARDRLEHTQAGTIKGKLRYLAPEMIDPARFSARGDFDHRIDVFAAGIILFELVAGRTLFTGNDELAVYDLITTGEIPDLSTERLCDPPLMRIIKKALQKNPDHRYLTAEDFADELRAYLYRSDPSFTSRRIAALMDRYFTEEKDAQRSLEEPDSELRDGPRELNLTRTAHTPSRAGASRSGREKRASSSSLKSGTSVERKSPKPQSRRTNESFPVAPGYLAAPDAETRVAEPGQVFGDQISETEADPEGDPRQAERLTRALAAGGSSKDSKELSTRTGMTREPSAASPRADEAHEDTPATSHHLESRRPRGLVLVASVAAVVSVVAAGLLVAFMESGGEASGQVGVERVDDVVVERAAAKEAAPEDTVPLVIAASPEGAQIEVVGGDAPPSPSPALFMVPRGGSLEVRVFATGYESRRERVQHRGEPQLTLQVDLAALPVPLKVSVSPATARLTVDGKPYREGMSVSPGAELVVAARAEGFEPLEERAVARAGEGLELNLKLEEKERQVEPARPRQQARARSRSKVQTGTLTITSSPWWGRVTVDGRTLEDTTPVTVKLKAGSHTVEVAHPPKGIVERFTVKIEPGRTLRRTVKFD